MRRRWIAAVLVLVVLGALVGCGEDDDTKAGSGTESTTTTRSQLLDNVPEPVITIAYLLQDELDGLGYDVGQIDDGYVARVTSARSRSSSASTACPPPARLDQATAVALRTATGRQSPTIVRSVQSVLTELGEYPGAIDGDYGPATIAAVTRSSSRPASRSTAAQVDAATLAAMVDLWRKKQPPVARSRRPRPAPTC